ncbi:MAG TPA: hypothetical protein VGA36_05795 [Nitriliruptorales bacterium]
MSLQTQKLEGGAYLNAYLNGMQFVLLALEGRLAQSSETTREDIMEVLYEYHELAMRMRERARSGVER